MIHRIFTVFDCKAEAYLTPFFMQTKGAAIRAFTDAVNEPGHTFNKHPEDYTLFEIGKWNDERAEFTTEHMTPTPLGKGLEFLERKDDAPIGDEAPILPGPAGGNSPQPVRPILRS